MTEDEIDRIVNPPLMGIHEDNFSYRGQVDTRPGMIAYAWPQFPFPILKPWQRAWIALTPRRYRWVLYMTFWEKHLAHPKR